MCTSLLLYLRCVAHTWCYLYPASSWSCTQSNAYILKLVTVQNSNVKTMINNKVHVVTCKINIKEHVLTCIWASWSGYLQSSYLVRSLSSDAIKSYLKYLSTNLKAVTFTLGRDIWSSPSCVHLNISLDGKFVYRCLEPESYAANHCVCPVLPIEIDCTIVTVSDLIEITSARAIYCSLHSSE